MDSFDEKRGVIKKLLSMLKDHASNEVSSGLKNPDGEGDMHDLEVEKVEVLPDHEMDSSTPEHEVDTKLVPENKETANLGYSKGGAVMDKPASDGGYRDAPHKGIPYESEEGHPDLKAPLQKEASRPLEAREASADSGPEVNASPFDNFMRPLKKRKSPMR